MEFESNNVLLDVRNLKVYYKSRGNPIKAVDDVSFTVNKGEIFGIVGESGCGKSTLANSVIGLIEPPAYVAGGEILFKGIDLLKLSEEDLNRKIRWKEISILPQAAMNALNPVMKLYDQLKDVIVTHKGDVLNRECLEVIQRLIKEVALPPYVIKAYPCQLSGGMRQRVLLAMAILLNPSLIIADEPTSALDVVTQRKILEFLTFQKERGSSVMLITHDIAVVAEAADRVMVMYAGKVMEIGNVFEIFDNPLHPYTQKLIDATPVLGIKRRVGGLGGTPPDLRDPPRGCRFHPRCPVKKSVCEVMEPKLKEVKPNQWVSCHLY